MLDKIFLVSILIFLQINALKADINIKIISKINDEIITNVDLKNEIKYLIFFNPNLKKINSKEQLILAKNSLVRQIIKKEEIEKYFELDNDKDSEIKERIINQFLKTKGFKNKNELLIYLEDNKLSYNTFKKKYLLINYWNTLIYEKYKKKLKIDKNKLKQRIKTNLNNKEKLFEYNLSEIVLDVETDYKEVKDFINEFGFESAANKYSIADTAQINGKIGWVNKNNLSEVLKDQILNLKKGENTEPIKIPNGKIVIKLNSKREIKNKINIDEELEKLINFERNRQLNGFSLNYFKKLKQNTNIYDY